MGNFRSLRVWQVAHDLTLQIYSITRGFPADERYGLTAQIRRAAGSIPANLAEGCGRDTDREIARYARVALGSANELDYHLILAHDLGYLPSDAYQEMSEKLDHVKRMLANLADTLSRKVKTADGGRRTEDG